SRTVPSACRPSATSMTRSRFWESTPTRPHATASPPPDPHPTLSARRLPRRAFSMPRRHLHGLPHDRSSAPYRCRCPRPADEGADRPGPARGPARHRLRPPRRGAGPMTTTPLYDQTLATWPARDSDPSTSHSAVPDKPTVALVQARVLAILDQHGPCTHDEIHDYYTLRHGPVSAQN